MNHFTNDLYAIQQKNLYPHKDFRLLVSPDSPHKNPCNPYPHPMHDGKTCSFIADWQLPSMEIYEIDNLNS